ARRPRRPRRTGHAPSGRVDTAVPRRAERSRGGSTPGTHRPRHRGPTRSGTHRVPQAVPAPHRGGGTMTDASDTPDAFEALRTDYAPLAPPPEFAATLRQRLWHVV